MQSGYAATSAWINYLTHPVQQELTDARDFSCSLGVIDSYILFIS